MSFNSVLENVIFHKMLTKSFLLNHINPNDSCGHTYVIWHYIKVYEITISSTDIKN